MNSSQVFIVPDTFISIIFFLIYFPVCGVVYWRIYPRLSTTSKYLASGFLAAIIFVIVNSLQQQTTSEFERWLWHPDMEWNIPSIISSTQLGLVGCLGILIACIGRKKQAWLRLYFFALGPYFWLLSLDEFFSWKSYTQGLHTGYVNLGAAISLATLIIITILPRRERIWNICLLIGFGLIAVGALLIDQNPRPCGSFGILRFDGCMRAYILEEALEFLGSWLTLVAMLGHFSSSALRSSPRVSQSLFFVPAIWVAFLILFSPSHNIEVSPPDSPADLTFESGTHLYGYRIDRRGLPTSIILRLPDDSKKLGLGYSIHLVEQESGVSLVSTNKLANRRTIVWPKRYGFVPLYRQAIDLESPSQNTANRALLAVLTLWRSRDGATEYERVLASDLELLSETQVILGELVIPAESAAAPTVPLAVFDNGFALAAAELPERAQPGDALSIPFTWRSDVDSQEDHVQFLHIGVAGSGEWFVYDQQPLGRRLPSRLWYSGLADSETWSVPLPADLAPGRYSVFTGLYRARDQERVNASDANGSPYIDARLPLGTLIIERM